MVLCEKLEQITFRGKLFYSFFNRLSAWGSVLHVNFSAVSSKNVSLDGTLYLSEKWKMVDEYRRGDRSVLETCLVSIFASSFRTPSGAEIPAFFWTTSRAIKPNPT